MVTIKDADKKKIAGLHKAGAKGILDILSKRKSFRKFPFLISLLASLVCCIFIFFQKQNKSFEVLQITTDLNVAFFPGLLGFSLGGYAISVGFSNTESIKRSTTLRNHNIYQALSAIFAISI